MRDAVLHVSTLIFILVMVMYVSDCAMRHRMHGDCLSRNESTEVCRDYLR